MNTSHTAAGSPAARNSALTASSHLDALAFGSVSIPRRQERDAVITFHAPVGLRSVLTQRSISGTAAAFALLNRISLTGTDCQFLKRLRFLLHDIRERWHAFVPGEVLEVTVPEPRSEQLTEVAEILNCSPALLLLALFVEGSTLDLGAVFPLPAKPDRRLVLPSNVLYFPGFNPPGRRVRRA